MFVVRVAAIVSGRFARVQIPAASEQGAGAAGQRHLACYDRPPVGAAEDFAKRFIDWGLDRWHSASGLAAVIAGVVIVGLAFFAGVNLAKLTPVE